MSVTVTRTPFTVTSIGNGTGSGFALSVMQASVAETGGHFNVFLTGSARAAS